MSVVDLHVSAPGGQASTSIRLRGIGALTLLAMLAGCGAGDPQSEKTSGSANLVDAKMIGDEANGDNWASYGRTYSEGHFSPLTDISTSNVSQLGLAWAYDLGTPLRADSQPLAANGVVYVATGLSIVQAIDAASGKLLWRYDPEVQKVAGNKLYPSWESGVSPCGVTRSLSGLKMVACLRLMRAMAS